MTTRCSATSRRAGPFISWSTCNADRPFICSAPSTTTPGSWPCIGCGPPRCWTREPASRWVSTRIGKWSAAGDGGAAANRYAVARHPATPVALLERLAADKSANVRKTVAEHPATPLATLECLLYDQDVRTAVCSGLSKNKPFIFAAPPLLIPEERAAVEARLTQAATQFTAAAMPSLSRLLALLSPWTPVPALAKYLRSTWWEERAAIAIHPATPPATRAKLADDGNAVVRAAARAMLAASSPAA